MNRQGKVTFNKEIFLDGRWNLNVNDVKENGLRILFFIQGCSKVCVMLSGKEYS
jgi:hypothetical protein